MKDLSPQWFEPSHQPDESNPVSFQLRPLDMATHYTLQASMEGKKAPSWEAVVEATKFIVDWKGVRKDGQDLPFSRKELRTVIYGGANFDWMIWLSQITGKLYYDALFTDDEVKN